MNYRFVKVTSFYRNFLKYYYSNNSDIKTKSYSEQYDDLMAQEFGWSNYYQLHLNKLGNEAFEIVVNADSLQSAWANEHGLPLAGESLLLDQFKFYKPEVIFFQDSFIFSVSFLKDLKKNVPSIKKIIGWCCSPFTDQQLEVYRLFDFVCTCSPKFVDTFNKVGIKSYRLNHAFESSLVPKLKVDNNYPESDFIFIGSFIGNEDFHNERIQLIESLLNKKVNLSLYSNLPNDNPIYIMGQKFGYFTANFLRYIGLNSLALKLPLIKKTAQLTMIPKKINFSREFKKTAIPTPLFGLEMMKALSKSKIGFNSHGGVAGDYAANIRLFEVTGVGSCLLTDHKKNITDFFEPDKEVVTYKSADECVEKIEWLLSHPNELKQIADAGQQRTLKVHSFKQRAEELNKIISDELSN
ncbi:MAG: glycosyltransferase [Ignavibacteriales bacterium]|nr:glycosyltransferase [Ignavibacteriales bacterium]